VGNNSENGTCIRVDSEVGKSERVKVFKLDIPAKAGPLRDPTYLYSSLYGSGGRSQFLPAEYDLAEIGKAEDCESYVTQAFVKRIGLMFKEGYAFVGPNPKTVEYVRARFRQIAQVSDTSTEDLIKRIGTELVKKSNAFVVKVRNRKASGGKPRKAFGSKKSLEPIAAYFIAPAETMSFKTDKDCRQVVRWKHSIEGFAGGSSKEFPVEDVAHLHFNRKEGFVFGTPTLIPVLDDIRALRKIEENVELLIYQHLFPLFHYKIGTDEMPATYTEDGYREIDVARASIQNLPAEGGIVTSHRHDIKLLGTEGRTLRAREYLEYFKRRVFAGLSMSAVDFGEPGAANRSTSDTMSRNLIDSVKDYQKAFETFFNNEIIRELLLEADFSGIDPLGKENLVELKFNEIDFDAKVKRESHYADMFLKNAISHDEMRIGIGKDPFDIPTVEEQRAGRPEEDRFREWYRTSWKLFEEPKALIQAVDEPYSAAAQAAVESPSLEVNQGELEQSQKMKEEVERKKSTAVSKDMRDFAQSSWKPRVSIIREQFDKIESWVKDVVVGGERDEGWIAAQIRFLFEDSKRTLISSMVAQFSKGYFETTPNVEKYSQSLARNRSRLESRANGYVYRLEEDVGRLIVNKLGVLFKLDTSLEELKKTVKIIFDSLRFRANCIDDAELEKAFILGQAYALMDEGVEEVEIVVNEGACDKCLARKGERVLLETFNVDRLPVYHPFCRCTIRTVS